MKSSRFISASAALAACVLGFATTASAQQIGAGANDATVLALAGNVSYAHNGGSFTALPVGVRLSKGDVIKTGPASHCDIQIGNNVGFVQIAPNSTLGINDLIANRSSSDAVTDTQLDLNQGAIFAKVNKLSKASRFEIKTPKGIAGVRGTTLYLTAAGELTVAEGTAGIAYMNGGNVQTFVLHDGESIAPGDTQPRPAAPGIIRDINDAMFDAQNHGVGRDIQPFVAPNETYISPVVPGA
jgi:hypothetical protein